MGAFQIELSVYIYFAKIRPQRFAHIVLSGIYMLGLCCYSKARVEERTAELVELSKKLAKYFSPQVYDSIFSGKLDVTIKTQRKQLTIFFSDLKHEMTSSQKLDVTIKTQRKQLTLYCNASIFWGPFE